MAYIGKAPNTAIVNQTTSQSFNGTGSATAFTLNRSVNVSEDLEVFVNNVQQEPGSGKAYTASGTTLTFDEAPPSGTGNVYVIYRGEATINPRLEHDANSALAATTGTFSDAVTVANGLTVDDDGATVLTLDRATSDGTVMELQKGGTAFGGMSVSDANNLSIDCTTTDHAGLTFATENILPRKNSANTDNAVDLGAGSARFKDAYLSGSVYADLIRHNDDTDTFIQWPGNNTLAFNTGGSERIRITSGGNIGINETNPTLMLSLQTGVSMGLGDLSDYSTKGILGNIHSSISSQSLGSTSVDDARNLGFGSTYVPSAGGTKPTSYGTIRCFEHYNGNLNKGARYISQLAVGHANNPAWYARNSNTTDGTSFGTWYQLDMTSTSDERSKENVEDAPDQLAVVKQFQVKEFDYIDNADEPRQLGMMAQHVDTFAPEYVTKDDEDPDIMWRIKYNKMVPMLVKALQEATTKIETLETEMTALKARVTALEGN